MVSLSPCLKAKRMNEQPEQSAPRNWWGPLWPLGEALRFLTILPTPGMPPMSEGSIARAIPLFPLAGALIGALLAGLGVVAGAIWGPPSRPVILVVAWAIITAGLHLDGLSDTFDAVLSWRSRERKLEIMKDSRIGAFGAAALVLAVLAKYAALTSMSPDRLDVSLITAQILGRWAFLPAGYFNSHAREGLGSEFMAGLSATTVFVGTVISIAAAILLGKMFGLLAVGASTAIIGIASIYFRRRIGGITGDCLGAIFQFVEVATYAAFLT